MATKRPGRKTYPQNWRAYNAAQTHEKAKFQELLSELCTDIKEPVRSRNGRPRLPLDDAIFCACFKVYSTVSGRRFMTDLREAQAKGFIARPRTSTHLQLPRGQEPDADPARVDHAQQPAAEGSRDGLRGGLLGLQHQPFREMVRP